MFFPEVEDIIIKQAAGNGIDFAFKDGVHVLRGDGLLSEVNGLSALKNWILKVVVTQVNAYEVYYRDEDGNFGVGIYDKLGTKERGYFLSELKREITEQLLENEEITEVKDFETEFEKRSLRVKFTVVTASGIEEEIDEDVYAFNYDSGGDYEPEPFIIAPEEAEFVEKLITNVSAFALIPKVSMGAEGYEWDGGRDAQGNPIKTFMQESAVTHREYIDIEGAEAKIMTLNFVTPSDITDIAAAQTGLITLNGKQLFFRSLSDFTAGFTTVSPRYYNPSIDGYTEDMYKCRCLKTSGTVRELFKIDTLVSGSEKTVRAVFNSAEGNEYGFKYKEDVGGVKVYKEYDGEEYEDIIFKVYEDEASAEADAENMPEGSVAIIRS